MAFLFLLGMIVVVSILYVVGLKFDSIERGDSIMYYEDNLQVYDTVRSNSGGEIITKAGKVFTIGDYIKGNFFPVRNKDN